MKLPHIPLPFGKKAKKTTGATPEVDSSSDDTPSIASENIELKRKASQDVSREAEGVITIGKVKYAVNLSRVLDDERGIADQVESLPAVHGVDKWDLYMRPSGGRLTFGSSNLGHKRGMMPLAEALDTKTLGADWAVGVRIGGQYWWVCTSVNGGIVEDSLVSDTSQARDILISSLTDGMRIYASTMLQAPGAIPAEIWDLLGSSKPSGLQKIGFLRNHGMRLGIIGITGLTLFGAWSFYSAHMEAMRLEEIRLAEARKKFVVVDESTYPWYSGYRMSDFLTDCAGAFSAMPLSIMDWDMQPMSCTYDGKSQIGITIGYMRKPSGRIADLRLALATHKGNVSLDDDGMTAHYTESWDANKDQSYFTNKPWDDSVIHQVLLERFQNIGVNIGLERPVMPNLNPRTMTEPAFFSHKANLVVNGYPSEYLSALSDIPAIVPQTLIWNPAIDQWGINFDVYHPPILPNPGGGATSRRGN